MFDPPQEVVRLEDEDHLAVDEGQEVGNVADVLLRVGLDLLALKLRKRIISEVAFSNLLFIDGYVYLRFALPLRLDSLLDRVPRSSGDHAREEAVELADPELVGLNFDSFHVSLEDVEPKLGVVASELVRQLLQRNIRKLIMLPMNVLFIFTV